MSKQCFETGQHVSLPTQVIRYTHEYGWNFQPAIADYLHKQVDVYQ